MAHCQRKVSGSNNCSVLTIAFAPSLDFGEDSANCRYDSEAIRTHLKT